MSGAPTTGREGRQTARTVAVEALRRVDDGAYANLVVPALLGRSGLDDRDRHLATALAYGTIRMRRAVDHLVARHWHRPPEDEVRRALHLGAYELAYLRTPAHAAVSQAVDLAPPRARGFANAVLRKVAADVERGVTWPDVATELSYPAWIHESLTAALGPQGAVDAMRAMDEPAEVTEREDGYVQDRASRWVAEAVGAREGDRVLDACAAPGGKATLLAATGASVVAADASAKRTGLVVANAARLGSRLDVLVADGRRPPFRPASFDRVLLDVPCSGLGVLRRRPDARWRVQPEDVADLVRLQRSLLAAAAPLVRPGGTLVISACTLTLAETAHDLPSWEALPPPGGPWEPWGRGARLLPQTAGTDGMWVLVLRAPEP